LEGALTGDFAATTTGFAATGFAATGFAATGFVAAVFLAAVGAMALAFAVLILTASAFVFAFAFATGAVDLIWVRDDATALVLARVFAFTLCVGFAVALAFESLVDV
jgi:hypothetical protein